MLALSLEQVKLIGAVISAVSVAMSILSMLLVRAVAKRIAIAAVFGVFAVVVWSQRSAVTECASQVASNVAQTDTECRFLGIDVTVPTGLGR